MTIIHERGWVRYEDNASSGTSNNASEVLVAKKDCWVASRTEKAPTAAILLNSLEENFVEWADSWSKLWCFWIPTSELRNARLFGGRKYCLTTWNPAFFKTSLAIYKRCNGFLFSPNTFRKTGNPMINSPSETWYFTADRGNPWG